MDLSTLATIKGGEKIEFTKATSLAPSVLAIGVSILVLIFIVWPKVGQVLRLKTDNKQLAQRATALENKVGILSSLDQGELETQLGAAEQLLPSEKSIFSLITQIERAAGASGVLLNRVEVAPGSVGSEDNKTAQSASQTPPSTAQAGANEINVASKVQMKVSLSGDYKSFLQFLNNVLSLSRVVAVKDLSISSSTSAGSSQVKASFLVEGYWLPIPKELASIESSIEVVTDSEKQTLEQVKTTGLSSPPSVVPQVPLGRPDIFAPF